MQRFTQFITEADDELEEDAPGNAAGFGFVAGLGVGPKGEPGVDLRKKRKQIDEINAADRERAAAHVHNQWMEKQKELGHDSHKSPDGKEEYMKPFHQLSDDAKDLDRVAVDAVIDGLKLKEEVETFAGAPVFEVDMEKMHAARFGKPRYHRYAKYVGSDEMGEAIRTHGRKTRGDIVLKDSKSAVMTYLRRKAS